jgi:L-lysine exporter family protein LysE/ArgO
MGIGAATGRGMLSAAFAGFALGLSLILAIGAQNAFVLRQGLRGDHVFWVVLTCAVSDAVLIAVGVGGFAAIEAALPGIAPAMRWGGAAFLFVYGALSFRRALGPAEALEPAAAGAGSLRGALLTCLALTWLNPHVYLDTVVLLGSVSTQYEGRAAAFAAGAMTASFVFFFSLGYGAGALRPLFARPAAWKVLEAVIGVVMWAIAAKLILG